MGMQLAVDVLGSLSRKFKINRCKPTYQHFFEVEGKSQLAMDSEGMPF
jgi:hypothetical protein